MRYNNGFQIISVDQWFVRDLRLYDPLLFIWVDPIDGNYHISYNEHKRKDSDLTIEYARKFTACSVGKGRRPDKRDLFQLMRNDQKHRSADDIVGSIKESEIQRRMNMEKERREMMKEAYYGLGLAVKRRPSKYL